jgi:hypothetical protein
MPKKQKPIYWPEVLILEDGSAEQRFRADHVAIDRDEHAAFVGFAQTEPATIHSMIIAWPLQGITRAEELYVEFNDQANGRTGSQVRLTLLRDQLVVDYDEEIAVGRIAYEPDDDPMSEPDEPEDETAQRVVVLFRVSDEMFAELTAEFRALANAGAAISLPGDGQPGA